VIYLAAFITSMGGEAALPRVEEYFKVPEIMDFAFEKFRDAFLHHLQKLQDSKADIDAVLLSRLVEENEGAGHLRHIQAMAKLVAAMDRSFTRGHTSELTKQALGKILTEQEQYFEKNRWGNEDRSYFYTITAEILNASPALYKDFNEVFQTLSPKEFRDFVENVYPLFQAQLVVMERPAKQSSDLQTGVFEEDDSVETKSYDPRSLVQIRRQLKRFVESVKAKTEIAEATKALREESLAKLKEGFKDRFGFSKLPETLADRDIRAIQDFLIYLGNLCDKNSDNTNLLIFYLALTINGKWEDFRQNKLRFTGESANAELSEYFDEGSEQFESLRRYLQAREATTFIPSEVIGLTDDEIASLQSILQEEVMVQHFGNIQTVDNKLEGILLGIDAYADPDTYPEQLRELIPIALEYGSSALNASIAKRIQNELGKNIPMSEQELEITYQLLESVGVDQNLSLLDQLKEVQSSLKLVAPSMNLVEKQAEYRQLIDGLRDKLKPTPDIIRIFSSLGEDFKTDSGAQAISQDLVFLESLASKNQDKITDENDKIIIADYINEIRDQMKILEKAILEIENKFKILLEEAGSRNAGQHRAVTQEIIGSMRSSEVAVTITSTATNQWIPIIENMRQCLACNTTGCNNDTNLTFGDPTQFYLYSQDASRSADMGSISDEIVFLSPISIDGKQEMSFVFDQIYGNHSPDVLYGHLGAITKKYAAIKAKFPQAKISIFLTQRAISSAGLNEYIIRKRFGSESSAYHIGNAEADVNIIESPSGDHYVEFAGRSRDSGIRRVGGVRISLKG